ncbi:hypothetical protein CFP56_016848, partial [Quercus suber]
CLCPIRAWVSKSQNFPRSLEGLVVINDILALAATTMFLIALLTERSQPSIISVCYLCV